MADSVRTGDGNDLCSELAGLGGCTPCYVTEAGDGDLLSYEILSSLLEKVLGEIEVEELTVGV